MDDKALFPGDRIVLSGSMDCLGNWDAMIELSPSPTSPAIWSVTVDMPLNMMDSYLSGLFEYKYYIESARDGRISEGQQTGGYYQIDGRRETKMRRNLFHSFRPNYSHARFRGWSAPAPVLSIEEYVSYYIKRLNTHDVRSADFLSIFDDLMDCIPGGHRGVIEGMLNDYLSLPVRILSICNYADKFYIYYYCLGRTFR